MMVYEICTEEEHHEVICESNAFYLCVTENSNRDVVQQSLYFTLLYGFVLGIQAMTMPRSFVPLTRFYTMYRSEVNKAINADSFTKSITNEMSKRLSNYFFHYFDKAKKYISNKEDKKKSKKFIWQKIQMQKQHWL